MMIRGWWHRQSGVFRLLFLYTGETRTLLKKVAPLANITRELGFFMHSLRTRTIKSIWLLLFLFLIPLLPTLPFLLLHLTKALWLVVMVIRKRKGRVKRIRIRKRKSSNHMLLMVPVLREHSENPSSLISFARGTTFLSSVLVSPVYKKSGIKGLNHLCHQPLIIMLMILPQPVTHW